MLPIWGVTQLVALLDLCQMHWSHCWSHCYLFSSLVPGCQDPIHLKHFGKREILKKIDLMEPEFDVPMAFDDSRVPNQPAAAGVDVGSWGYGVQVYGAARGHHRKKEMLSLIADMFGFFL